MKPSDWFDNFWPEWEPKPTLVEFGLTLAVFVLILLAIFVYYVLFWAAS